MLLGLDSTPFEQWMDDPRAMATAIRHHERIAAEQKRRR